MGTRGICMWIAACLCLSGRTHVFFFCTVFLSATGLPLFLSLRCWLGLCSWGVASIYTCSSSLFSFFHVQLVGGVRTRRMAAEWLVPEWRWSAGRLPSTWS